MVELLVNILSAVLLLTGGVFAVIGGLGLLRFPDFYTRLHAGGVTDTLAPLLIVAGLVLQSGFSLLSLKLLLILLFLLFTTPTASHALARAALAEGIQPQTDKATRKGEEASSNS
ncbi:monovalent cation/H(+) antiporter subunit G [Sediminicurvatus halobius]|uniref:Sodium:proton antiporter n=1 Tax=Sediminicurvatus halobius TaxID=2182432 RepID=A0A2U2N849_9GAMM|nr:monovalent cation/H(+) antiporter subunit G [Spiribacter halobius]PWG65129.1 sodium:proton antiporter [Spiribacter halobius]UEX78922.1 monovalent cation/H(+) antiporter subunit G [Spiribacter halobius]